MNAEDFVLDDSCERHSVEYLVYSSENRLLVFSVLVTFSLAFIGKSEPFIGLNVLVVASDQMNLIRKHTF